MMPLRAAAGAMLLAMLPAAGSAPAARPAPGEVSQVEFDAMPDMPGTGPYPAIREIAPGLPGHVLYRPADLARLGKRKLGLYIWGNSACRADAASARLHLLEVASHGYLAIASGEVRSGPGATAPVRPTPVAADGSFQVETNVADLRTALDWALAESKRPGSSLFRRIDRSAIAAAGQSCGGLQAIQLGADPRVRTVVVLNSGTIPPGVPNPLRGIASDSGVLAGLHTPLLIILGGPRDIAYPYGVADYRRIGRLPVVMANIDTGHPGTTRQPNGGPVAAMVANWLDWQFRGNKRAAALFLGVECGYCRDPRWTMERKNLPAAGRSGPRRDTSEEKRE